MIESSVVPGRSRRTVAQPAIGRETDLGMIGILGRLIITRMTSDTLHRYGQIFIAALPDMAGVAIDDRMRPHQREPALGV